MTRFSVFRLPPAATLAVVAALVLLSACSRPVHALVGPQPAVLANMPTNSGTTSSCYSRKASKLFVSGGGRDNDKGSGSGASGGASPQEELKDYGAQMSALFGNLRVPSALFAGASAAAAFAMPLGGADGLKLGLVKRLYALLMMSALSCQLLAIIVSTLAMGSIAVTSGDSSSTEPTPRKAATMAQYIELNYDLSWVTTRLNFMVGLLFFVVGAGLRAWATLSCPIFARASLGIIASSTLLAVAFVEDSDRVGGCGNAREGLGRMVIKYVRLLGKKSLRSPLFAAGVITLGVTWSYVVYNIPHVWQYLVKTGGTV